MCRRYYDTLLLAFYNKKRSYLLANRQFASNGDREDSTAHLNGKKIACDRHPQGRRQHEADFERYLCQRRPRLSRTMVPGNPALSGLVYEIHFNHLGQAASRPTGGEDPRLDR
jgi:hypothetical protein